MIPFKKKYVARTKRKTLPGSYYNVDYTRNVGEWRTKFDKIAIQHILCPIAQWHP
jgi:hypothetical protein